VGLKIGCHFIFGLRASHPGSTAKTGSTRPRLRLRLARNVDALLVGGFHPITPRPALQGVPRERNVPEAAQVDASMRVCRRPPLAKTPARAKKMGAG